MAVNDNHEPNRPLSDEPDAHGQAAYLLVECLLHALRERGVLSTALAIEVVESAAEVAAAMAEESRDPPPALRRCQALIGQVLISLRADAQ